VSVLLPWLLALGALTVAGIAALHLLARNEPPRFLLPTARFVPESRERAPARSFALSDRRLLALRVIALVAIALAAAGPWWRGAGAARAQVIVADLSRTVHARGDVVRAVRAAYREGDRVVVLDSTPRAVSLAELDSLASQAAPQRVGRLSAALLRAREEARTLARGADSVALVIVSPMHADVLDAATAPIRATWPGAIRIEGLATEADSVRDADRTRVAVRASAADPMRATLALDGRLGGDVVAGSFASPTSRGAPSGAAPRAPRLPDRTVRLIRSATLTADDSSAARSGSLVVHWPESLPTRDTVGAVATARAVFVATLPRPVALDGGTTVAHWVDGTAAAVESPLGAGCIRRVAIPLASAGDAALRASFRAVVRDLLAPCGGLRDATPLDSAALRAFMGTGGAAASAALLTPTADAALVRWLLVLAALALTLEWWLRRRQEGA
jgi:hypothetical protein